MDRSFGSCPLFEVHFLIRLLTKWKIKMVVQRNQNMFRRQTLLCYPVIISKAQACVSARPPAAPALTCAQIVAVSQAWLLTLLLLQEGQVDRVSLADSISPQFVKMARNIETYGRSSSSSSSGGSRWCVSTLPALTQLELETSENPQWGINHYKSHLCCCNSPT
ncbi:hypothetical protein EYF80_021029 [Liparis tanakae]|uniref:Uncharacterized protein n=1 Tax=Liparis tanakae TaxID=230148 RepID=A0A4Z2HSN2_9TELE|nr:hypothetical protein EYF80_021029 [Liparis tanakae]